MRKLLLTTVSGLALGVGATAALAGSSSTFLTQTGNSQSATIDQSGAISGKVGYNAAYPLLQQNLDPNATPAQNGTGSNVISITQQGTGNAVYGEWLNGVVTENSADYYAQSGTSNRANIQQLGNNSTVNLQQTGALNGPNNIQGVHGYWSNDVDGGSIVQDATSSGSTVNLTQTNSSSAVFGNAFNIGQGGTNNLITATQTGDNLLWVRQGTSSPDVWWAPMTPVAGALSNSTITVNQNGGYVVPPPITGVGNYTNYAALAQGNGSGSSITVTQLGDANSADVNQSDSSNIFSSDQVSFSGNTSWNYVGGEGGWPGDSLPITQTGNSNYVSTYQNGFSNASFGSQTGASWLTSSQTGSNNSLNFTQSGGATLNNTQSSLGGANTVVSTQTSGSATITQTDTDGTAANSITNTQAGGSSATLSQIGYGLTITSGQSGSLDSVTVNQSGNTNSIGNTQTGSNDALTVTAQSGSGNSIVNSQSGAGPNGATISQTGTGGNINNTQSGAHGSASYTQAGTGDTATLQNQTGSWNSFTVVQASDATSSLVLALQNGSGASGTGNQNVINVSQQTGTGMNAYLVQGGTFSFGTPGVFSTITLASGTASFNDQLSGSQTGSSLNIAVSQNSSNNTVSYSQSGTGSHATISQ
jgi:hypothetical protein